MIGVLVKDNERPAAAEFFQLFKTSWEVWQPNRRYDVVIATCDAPLSDLDARTVIVYSSAVLRLDAQLGVPTGSPKTGAWAQWQGGELPLYGAVAEVGGGEPVVQLRDGSGMVGTTVAQGGLRVVRIGFDLFAEVSFLLGKGQPAANGQSPTLDLHIALLRTVLTSLGVGFVEVLPTPAGYEFMACLSHDVDFVGIRDHKLDRTILGFLYRCFVGSGVDALRGRLSWKKCLRNCLAGLSLPLVFLGWMDDFWLEFERYKRIERGLGSTFFFIPFRGVPGTRESGPAPAIRAAKYDVAAIRKEVVDLVKNRCEIGVHGLDAWNDTAKGRAELARIETVADAPANGIRMHWLYWGEHSPKTLEDAGFAYDSTFGYNDAVGFRAGTSQVFRPLNAEHLLELPLNIQDSALFYPDRMNLSERAALDACRRVIRSAVSTGGVLTLNWHTRSLSPERLWGDFYILLLDQIRSHNVWFGTARQIVDWFRQRRAFRFDAVRFDDGAVHVALSGGASLPTVPFLVRVHHPQPAGDPSPGTYTDIEWLGEDALSIPCPQFTV